MRLGGGMIHRILFRSIIACCAALFVVFLTPPSTEGASTRTRAGAAETAKKRTERIKRFLHRSIDELDQSLFFAREDIGDIQGQIEAITFAGLSLAEEELRSLTDWLYDYEAMLGREHAAFEQDLNTYYAGSSEARGWISRYENMRERHLQMKTGLAERVKKLEEERRRAEDKIFLMKNEVIRLRTPERDDETPLRREKRDSKKRDPREDEQLIAQLEAELRAFEQLILQYNALIEKTRGASDWLSLKMGDYEALDSVAKAINGQDLTAIESAYNGIIRIYDADIFFLNSRIEEFDRKRSSLTRSGTLSTIDRQEELSRYYERRKSRYERQLNWLKVQIGNYRAELVDIWSEADVKRNP